MILQITKVKKIFNQAGVQVSKEGAKALDDYASRIFAGMIIRARETGVKRITEHLNGLASHLTNSGSVQTDSRERQGCKNCYGIKPEWINWARALQGGAIEMALRCVSKLTRKELLDNQIEIEKLFVQVIDDFEEKVSQYIDNIRGG